jgi:hypothetical protein
MPLSILASPIPPPILPSHNDIILAKLNPEATPIDASTIHILKSLHDFSLEVTAILFKHIERSALLTLSHISPLLCEAAEPIIWRYYNLDGQHQGAEKWRSADVMRDNNAIDLLARMKTITHCIYCSHVNRAIAQ